METVNHLTQNEQMRLDYMNQINILNDMLYIQNDDLKNKFYDLGKLKIQTNNLLIENERLYREIEKQNNHITLLTQQNNRVILIM